MKTTSQGLRHEQGGRRRQGSQDQPAVFTPPQMKRGPSADPEHEEVERKAYECWMSRGCPEGSPEEDWFEAERELRQEGA